jgi:signal transduction histidine kinase
MVEMGGVEDAELVAKLKKVLSLSVHTGTEIGKLIKELRPTLLDALGLPAAIRRYAEDSLQHRGIDVSVDSIGMDERLPSEIEVELFRIAQGAIGNIVEHSEARKATILLQRHANSVLMCIEDDGKGFDVTKLTGVDDSGRGSGLFTMKERVKLVGGKGTVESQPGQGTKVTVEVPITESREYAEDKSAGSG